MAAREGARTVDEAEHQQSSDKFGGAPPWKTDRAREDDGRRRSSCGSSQERPPVGTAELLQLLLWAPWLGDGKLWAPRGVGELWAPWPRDSMGRASSGQ
jgi:hypothetical protein